MPHSEVTRKELRAQCKKAKKAEKKAKRSAKRSDARKNRKALAELIQFKKVAEEFMETTEVRYKNTVQSTVLPIVAAVICKAIYRFGFGLEEQQYRFGDRRPAALFSMQK